MVVFLANRANLQTRRLHDRIKTKVRGDLTTVRRRRAEPREAGAYRVVGELDPRAFLENDEYPAATARVEIGFQLQTEVPYEHYWFNWIEPDRGLLVGWHQDDTHNDLGPVHLQLVHQSATIAREPARFIDSHPLDVVGQRMAALPTAVTAVEWNDRRPVGLDPSAPVIA